VKKETKRLEPPKDTSLSALAARGVQHVREAILPNDPRDAEIREQSGEPVVALVGAVDLWFLLSVAVLLVIGTVMVYSASLAFAVTNDNSASYYLIRQTEWLLVGGIGMYLAMRVDYHRWRHLAGVGLVVSALGLLALHTHFGYAINGSLRWLRFSSFLEIQPSEFAKMGLILYAAHWFANQRAELRHSLRGLVPFAVVVSVIVALVFKQPDLGTTAVILVSLFAVYFIAGARALHLALLAVVAVIGFKLYQHHMAAYQVQRWQAFLDPWKEPNGSGYHYVQLLNALGTGGPTGVGLGQSQSKYTMPEPHTDSIFAILGEEWGFVGTVGVLALFLLFAVRGLRASMLAPDLFGRLLAAGLTGSIVFQALLNMAVVAKVVPFTGVPLPFISYGGSSLSISMVAAGILLNISKHAISLQEERSTALTNLRWRNRGAYLSLAGHGTAAHAPASRRAGRSNANAR
jgi:cell division protein FtsW